jgi:DNA-binding NarL/FixJ family response regulator
VELSGGTIHLYHDQSDMNGIAIAYHFDMPVDLTEREDEILRLLAEGLTNKQIANQLHITVRTVKYHLDNLYSKLAVSSRTEAAIYALRRGIVRQPPVLKDRS